MNDLPAELIEAIAWQLEDKASLKACALVSSGFREASQRSLFLSLGLGGRHGPYARTHEAACALLTESPHLGAYVTKLTVTLSSQDLPSGGYSVESLCRALDKLPHVTACTMRGDSHICRWAHIELLGRAIIDFAERMTVTELNVLFIQKLPLPILGRLVAIPRIMSFLHVGARSQAVFCLISAAGTSHLEYLLLEGSSSVVLAFTRPEFTMYHTNLRRLALDPSCIRLLEVGFPAVQDLQLKVMHSGVQLPSLASLPALRVVDLVLRFPENTSTPWLRDTLATLLATSPPGLAEIRIAHTRPLFPVVSPHLHPGTFSGIDTLLAGSSLCLRWRLSYSGRPSAAVQAPQRLAEFAADLQRGMPQLHTRGKLIVEDDTLGGELGE
ncbi:hypothetical protein B0H11DRAFT_2269900 [Mycena galericulata]|nr:hypothetical protein B0H11DRAFT_2269900 [Mycena galericulata]